MIHSAAWQGRILMILQVTLSAHTGGADRQAIPFLHI